jgi:hypothetical protein
MRHSRLDLYAGGWHIAHTGTKMLSSVSVDIALYLPILLHSSLCLHLHPVPNLAMSEPPH